MASKRPQPKPLFLSLRRRCLTVFQLSGIGTWMRSDTELKDWEYNCMMVRLGSIGGDLICSLILPLFGSPLVERLDLAHWAFVIVFLVIIVLGALLHLIFHNDAYVRVRQWLFTLVRMILAIVFFVWDLSPNGLPYPRSPWSRRLSPRIMVAAAGFGLAHTALGSYILSRVERRRHGLKRDHPWNSTFDIHPGTKHRLKQMSEEERARRQDNAIEYVTEKGEQPPGERTARWYRQRSTMASLPDSHTPLALRDVYKSTSLFSRCYCCLDSDPFTETSTKLKKTRNITKLNWQRNRIAFLQQPAIGDFDNLSPLAGMLDDFGSHRLCEKCEFMCSKSHLINLSSWHWEFSLGPLPEMFEHYSNPKELQQSATSGTCHLCAMIWGIMSEEQQTELLEIDDLIVKELEGDLGAMDIYAEGEKEAKREEYHQKRCITIRLESRTPYSHYTRTACANYPQDILRLGHGPRLIPHFGRTRIPRAWENKRLVKGAIAIGLDPALVPEPEQAPAILIRGGHYNTSRFQSESKPLLFEPSTFARNPAHTADLGYNNKGPLIPPISTSTGSDVALNLASAWLKSHDECVRGRVEHGVESVLADEGIPLVNLHVEEVIGQAHVLPTRLIDVCSDKIRLRLSSEIADRSSVDTRYVALSHCWGGSHFLTLTKSNYQCFVDGQDLSILCQTFQDAIQVTRKLGYSYIWIDSLCIIQDTDDCSSELSKMGDVYTNADCVIAAAAAWDDTETLFTSQNPLIMSPCLVRVAGRVGKFGGFLGFEGIYAFPDSRFTYNAYHEISFARLSSRAWCMQELKLAKRILWFGHSQLQFICKGEGKIFSQASLFARQYGDYPFGRASNKLDVVKRKLQGGDDLLRKQWWDLVEEYTSRWLTYEIDKLGAIGGMASFFKQEQPNADYLAGLWSGPHFILGLLWYVVSRRQASPRPLPAATHTTNLSHTESSSKNINISSYRAPSWSWASIDGIIRNDSHTGSDAPSTCLATLIDIAHLSPLNASTPHIRVAIRGTVQAATWAELPATEPMHYIGHQPMRDIKLPKHLGLLVPVTFDPFRGPKCFALLDGRGGAAVGWFLPDCEGDMPAQLLCLRVRVEPEDEGGKRNFALPFVVRGVALVAVGDGEDGREEVFRRVGYFELRREEGGVRYPDMALPPPESLANSSLPLRWPYPNVDPEGFFAESEERVIWIE